MLALQDYINSIWRKELKTLFEAERFHKLASFIAKQVQHKTVYPPLSKVFYAFNCTPPDAVKVVILGQDPYHGANQAHGLSFSVPDGVKKPPSLKNILTELAADTGATLPESGNLSAWAKQGVLLLNAVLTVNEGEAGSHKKAGWQQFTDAVIEHIAQNKEGIVFILWGNYAIQKKALIPAGKHLVLEAPHPSPLSVYRGFYGSKPFSQANAYLIKKGKKAINWQL